MLELLRMPAVAASTTEAVLMRWPFAVGTAFAAKDVIATVETEKALVDVEAEAAGRILVTLVDEGAEVSVGAPIAVICGVDEQVPNVAAALAALGVGEAAAVAEASPAPVVAPTHQAPIATAPVPAAAAPAASPSPSGRLFVSPLARRMASEAGLLLADLVGTGPGGRIVRRDVEAAVAQRVALEEAQLPTSAASAAPVADVVPADTSAAPAEPATGWVDEPLSRMRRLVAARLTESKTTAPHFYVKGSARIDRLLALRAELNAGGGTRVSVNDLVVKAVGHAHVLEPGLNVIWTGDALRRFDRVDVAVAVATDKGLVTPVVRGVDRLSLSATAAATADYVARAKSGGLQQHELEGGSVTVTNLGMFGVEEFSAILNPPQASILAVGAARQEPVVMDGLVGVATVLRVTLSVDHRPVDGATAARWMAGFVALLETPLRILA